MLIKEDNSLSWYFDYLPERAQYNLERLDEEQFNRLENAIIAEHPDGIEFTALVDLLKYNDEKMLEMAGYYDD